MIDEEDIEPITLRSDKGMFVTFVNADGKREKHAIEITNSYETGLSVSYFAVDVDDDDEHGAVTLGNEFELWSTVHEKLDAPQPGDTVFFTSMERLAQEGIVVRRMNDFETLVTMVYGGDCYAVRTASLLRRNENSWIAPVEIMERIRAALRERV